MPQPQVSQHLERDLDDKVLFGVSSGLAAYFAVDTVLVRVGFVLTALLTSGAMIIVYIALAVLMPVKGEHARSHMHSSDDPSPTESGGWQSAGPGGTGSEGAPNAAPRQYPARASNSNSQDLSGRRRQLAGWLIILLGALILAANLGAFKWVTFGVFFSAALIAAGALLLVGAFRRRDR